VGALGDRRKAFDSVFTAWTSLCRRADWDADLLVVGSGRELSAWRARAREAGLEDRVRFTGFRRDMPTVFAAIDVLVHPARYEAYGLGVHESLCRGVPALVSAGSGVAERYPRELADLLIADADNPGELAERLRMWRGQTERYRELVRPVAESLRARTWDHMAADVAGFVEQAGAA
jgi:glycosyltransferase involved in cell wall biosynthesis